MASVSIKHEAVEMKVTAVTTGKGFSKS